MIFHNLQQLTWLNIASKLLVMASLLVPQVVQTKCPCQSPCGSGGINQDNPSSENSSCCSETPKKETTSPQIEQTCCCCCSDTDEGGCCCSNGEEEKRPEEPEDDSSPKPGEDQEVSSTSDQPEQPQICSSCSGKCNCAKFIKLEWTELAPSFSPNFRVDLQLDWHMPLPVADIPVFVPALTYCSEDQSIPPWEGSRVQSLLCKWLI